MTTLDDILRAGSARKGECTINGVALHISEMSVMQQEEYNKIRKDKKEGEGVYFDLLKVCCEEMHEITKDQFNGLAANFVTELCNNIVALSEKGDAAKK